MAGQHGQQALFSGASAAQSRKAGRGDCCRKGYPCHRVDSADDLRVAGAGAASQSKYKQALAEDQGGVGAGGAESCRRSGQKQKRI